MDNLLAHFTYRSIISELQVRKYIMQIPIKSHKTNRTPQPIAIKDARFIHRYNKPISSFSYMVRVLNK